MMFYAAQQDLLARSEVIYEDVILPAAAAFIACYQQKDRLKRQRTNGQELHVSPEAEELAQSWMAWITMDPKESGEQHPPMPPPAERRTGTNG